MSAQKIGLPSLEFVIGKSLKSIMKKAEQNEFNVKIKHIEYLQLQTENKIENEKYYKPV